MAALPYIQLYVADYLADTIHLTAEEHGAYLLIIMNYWQTGKPIPKDRLKAITRIQNGSWEGVEETLRPFFDEDEEGNWIHERIEEDLEKVKSKSIKCSRAGKASARSKALKDKEKSTNVQHAPQQTFNHTEADTEADTEAEDTNKSSPTVSDPVPYSKIIDLYHRLLPNNPSIASLSATRKSQIKARWKNDIPDIDAWERYFTHISKSRFLTGRAEASNGRKVFVANIDFLIKENNMLKIIEGNYND